MDRLKLLYLNTMIKYPNMGFYTLKTDYQSLDNALICLLDCAFIHSQLDFMFRHTWKIRLIAKSARPKKTHARNNAPSKFSKHKSPSWQNLQRNHKPPATADTNHFPSALLTGLVIALSIFIAARGNFSVNFKPSTFGDFL